MDEEILEITFAKPKPKLKSRRKILNEFSVNHLRMWLRDARFKGGKVSGIIDKNLYEFTEQELAKTLFYRLQLMGE